MQQAPVTFKIAIIKFPGLSGENDVVQAVLRAGMEAVEFLCNDPSDKLNEMAGYIIAGHAEGTSKADELAANHPIVQTLKTQSERGKPVLGIGHGAHVLLESGLVPGLEDYKVGMVLTDNKRLERANEWVTIRLSDQYQRNAFTKYLTPQHFLQMPLTDTKGRFKMSLALWQEIEMQGLHIFQYCNEQGEIIDDDFVNPTGSWQNIAAIANKLGNVMAMLPHPERAPAGDAIFQAMRDFLSEPVYRLGQPYLDYYPRP